jgi:hypothetical protein
MGEQNNFATKFVTKPTRLYKAHRYKAFGGEWCLGKIHELDADTGKALCGKIPGDNFPGDVIHGSSESVTCKACLNVAESRRKQDEWRVKFEIENKQRELEKQRQTEEWWREYNAYLLTPEWRSKRAKVIKRANGMCEGCAERPCTQVHHLTYERVFHEMLFDLRAVCDECHDQIHCKPQRVREAYAYDHCEVDEPF